MKPSQLMTLLCSTIASRLPVLIVGGPGVGKTSIVAQAAAHCDNDLVIAHPAVEDPTDAKGFPWIEKGKAEFVLFGETRKVVESKRPTVWFWDDLGQAQAAVQSSRMPWLLARENCGKKLPEHVTIIAATNRRTDRAGVSGVLEPVKSRFTTIAHLEPDINEWCNWAVTQPYMPPEVIAYLRSNADDLDQFKPSADLVNCPVPRTWESAGRIITSKMPAEVEAEALAGAIGEGMTAKLMGFLQMYRELPSIDSILKDPNGMSIPDGVSVLYSICTGLAHRATENFKSVCRFAERLDESGHGEYAALVARDVMRRFPNLQTTPEFVLLMAGPVGELVGGTVS